jgi:lysozyme
MKIHSTTQNGIEFIKKFEGFNSKLYICNGGFKTIGYGHKILPNETYQHISIHDAEKLLSQDLRKFELGVISYIKAPLTESQFDALVSFSFNLGLHSLQRSTLRHKLNYGDYDGCACEFLRWIYAGGRRLGGLIKRRKFEQLMFLGKLT